MNKDKTIKDLKKRNDQLMNQYRLRDIRCVHLENENKKLQKKAELGEHYKHLYSEVKKQKDDVVEYIKNELVLEFYNDDLPVEIIILKLLRMLGEIDENNI